MIKVMNYFLLLGAFFLFLIKEKATSKKPVKICNAHSQNPVALDQVNILRSLWWRQELLLFLQRLCVLNAVGADHMTEIMETQAGLHCESVLGKRSPEAPSY